MTWCFAEGDIRKILVVIWIDSIDTTKNVWHFANEHNPISISCYDMFLIALSKKSPKFIYFADITVDLGVMCVSICSLYKLTITVSWLNRKCKNSV